MTRVKGFTLIELMVTIAVLAIAIAIAAPNFSKMIVRNQAESQRSALVGAFNLARSEAIKRAKDIQVVPINSSWTNGWQVKDGTEVLREFPALKNASVTSAVTSVTYNSRGRLTGTGVNASTQYAFAYRVGNDHCKVERDININVLGRVAIRPRVCS